MTKKTGENMTVSISIRQSAGTLILLCNSYLIAKFNYHNFNRLDSTLSLYFASMEFNITAYLGSFFFVPPASAQGYLRDKQLRLVHLKTRM